MSSRVSRSSTAYSNSLRAVPPGNGPAAAWKSARREPLLSRKGGNSRTIGPVCARNAAAQGESRSLTRRSTERKSGFGTCRPGVPMATAVTAAGALMQQRNPSGSCVAYSCRSADWHRRVVAPIDAHGREQRMPGVLPQSFTGERGLAARARVHQPSPARESSTSWSRSGRPRRQPRSESPRFLMHPLQRLGAAHHRTAAPARRRTA